MFDVLLVEPYPLTSAPFSPVKEMAKLFPISLLKIYQIPHRWKITVTIIGTGSTVTARKVNLEPYTWCCGGGPFCKPYVLVSSNHDAMDWGEHIEEPMDEFHFDTKDWEEHLAKPTDVFHFDPKKNHKMYLIVRGFQPCSCPFFIRFSDQDDSKMIGFTVRKDAPRLEW